MLNPIMLKILGKKKGVTMPNALIHSDSRRLCLVGSPLSQLFIYSIVGVILSMQACIMPTINTNTIAFKTNTLHTPSNNKTKYC